MTSFDRLLLAIADVEFIIVGRVAGGLHGAARATYDLDIVYRCSTNSERTEMIHRFPLRVPGFLR